MAATMRRQRDGGGGDAKEARRGRRGNAASAAPQKSASSAQLGRNTCPIISRASALVRPVGRRPATKGSLVSDTSRPSQPSRPSGRSRSRLARPASVPPLQSSSAPSPHRPLGEPEIIDALVYARTCPGGGEGEEQQKDDRRARWRSPFPSPVQRLVLRRHARTHARTQPFPAGRVRALSEELGVMPG
jgi:hypothetical protein